MKRNPGRAGRGVHGRILLVGPKTAFAAGKLYSLCVVIISGGGRFSSARATSAKEDCSSSRRRTRCGAFSPHCASFLPSLCCTWALNLLRPSMGMGMDIGMGAGVLAYPPRRPPGAFYPGMGIGSISNPIQSKLLCHPPCRLAWPYRGTCYNNSYFPIVSLPDWRW